MSTKGFLLLIATVVAIGGSIGGAFSGGLALGRSQSDDAASEFAILQQLVGGQSFSGTAPGGAFTGGQLGGGAPDVQGFRDGQRFRSEGDAQGGQDAPSGFGGGNFGGPGGFSGGAFFPSILSGSVSAVDGNLITVTTDSGETQVTIDEDSTIQIYEAGTVNDLSTGDRVTVILAGDAESGEPASAASVIVNPPDLAGIFGGGGFGGGRQGFGGRPRGQ